MEKAVSAHNRIYVSVYIYRVYLHWHETDTRRYITSQHYRESLFENISKYTYVYMYIYVYIYILFFFCLT